MARLVKTSAVLATVLSPLFLFSTNVHASEVTGNLSSDFATLSGVVVIPPPPPPPPPPSGGGNTGGGGGNTGGGGGTGSISTPPITKKSDLNNDNKVDKYDFALMMGNWNKTGINSCDLNNDNKVDKYDFALLMSSWSK